MFKMFCEFQSFILFVCFILTVLYIQWRDINWVNNEADLQFLRNYTPQVKGQQLRVFLHGPAGAGKSSFINSVQSVLRGRIYRQALVDNTSHDSFTKEFNTFKIPKDPESFYPFVFNDTMGLSTTGGILEEDLKLALKGHMKEGYRFNPESPLPETEEFYNKCPKLNDKVHILVCVIPATTLSIMSDKVVEKIRKVREEASRLKIPQFAMLTKIDEAFPEIEVDVQNVYKLPSVKDQMRKFSVDVGIPMNCIFPVKNYYEEIELNKDMNTLILSAMKNIIYSGDDFIKFIQRETGSDKGRWAPKF
ncbi:interferon-induced protein 44 isoform X2 [Kryptolebias marmoratus]|uniref:interferon-induced protein 44 isoform X2 n=1 Tax=Kryptolebias marmoratus TaxID=37003 RepID=UPI0018ACBB70|nr:interferon-induced protein 44 isoform X2 [Kryptolebias marmoratus]